MKLHPLTRSMALARLFMFFSFLTMSWVSGNHHLLGYEGIAQPISKVRNWAMISDWFVENLTRKLTSGWKEKNFVVEKVLNSNHRLCYKVLETEVMLIAGTFTLVTGFLIRLWAVESPYLTSIINQNEIVSPLTSWKRGEFSFKTSQLSVPLHRGKEVSSVQACQLSPILLETHAIAPPKLNHLSEKSLRFLPHFHQSHICYHWAKNCPISNLKQLPHSEVGKSGSVSRRHSYLIYLLVPVLYCE